MPATLNHHSFPQPAKDTARLWRYMDLAKYVSLLKDRSLFFARLDKFSDKYEGSLTKHHNEYLQSLHEWITKEPNNIAILRSQSAETTLKLRDLTYASCWHQNDQESMAMWDLYASRGQGICISTRYCDLANALSEDIFLGKVNYINYDSESYPVDNFFSLVMHKRKAYEYEQEVRAIIWTFGSNSEHRPRAAEFGIQEEVDLDLVAKEVLVHPNSPPWFLDVVSDVSERYGLKAAPAASTLSLPPIF